MDGRTIEQAYGPFVEAARGGSFRLPGPDEGWTADMVVAHVTLNNDHWTRAAHELLASGAAAYDNETAIDEDVLLRHVRATGGAVGLLADLDRSIKELAAVYDALGAVGGTEVQVRIVSDGEVVRDRPAALSDMIVGNSTYHLQMHLEQLLALRVD